MKISCDMAIDLIPLYKDGAASEDSRNALEEHLRTCKDCSRIFRCYTRDTVGNHHRSYLEPTKSIERKYTHLANELHKKHMTDTVSMVCAVAVTVGAVMYLLIKADNN